MSTMDVSLRLKLINQLRGPAKDAQKDLHDLASSIQKLNGAGGADKLVTHLNKASAAAAITEKEVKDISAAVRQIGATGGGEKLATDLKKTAAAASSAEKEVKDVAAAAKQLGAASGGGKLAGDLKKVSNSAKQAETDINRLKRSSDAIGASRRRGSHSGMGEQALDAGDMLGLPMMGTLGRMGRIAGPAAIGVGVGMGLTAATGEAMKFEDAMAEVRKAVDLPPEGLAEIERTILKLSRTTPLAKEEIAKLVAQAGFAGRPAEDLVRFATFAAKAAVAFGMTAEQAGDDLAQLGNVFDLTQDGIEEIGDAINALGDNAASKERDIIEFLKVVGASAKSFGLAERQTAAFGSAILSLGIAPAVASTGFTALITNLSTAEKGTKSFKAGLAALGLNGKQVAKMIKNGPEQAIIDILKRVNALPSDKRTGVLVDLFGKEYQDDVARMAGALPKIIAGLDLVRDKSKTKGSVDRSFNIFDELTSSKIKKAGHQFEVLGVRIGKALTPGIGAAADALAGFLEKINTTLDRIAETQAMADKLTAGKDLSQEEKDRLKKDPDLNRQFQGQVAAKDHPVIGLIQQMIELEKELAAAQAAAGKGDMGAANQVMALQAALAQIKSQVESAMKMPGAAEAVAQSMRAITAAVSTEGEAAVQAAQVIADRIKALFNFTASPTISPTFAPGGGGGDGGTPPSGNVPLPPRRPKKMSAAGGQTFAQSNTFHISGGDPEATALAVERRLARLGSSSDGLYDMA